MKSYLFHYDTSIDEIKAKRKDLEEIDKRIGKAAT